MQQVPLLGECEDERAGGLRDRTGMLWVNSWSSLQRITEEIIDLSVEIDTRIPGADDAHKIARLKQEL